MDDEKWTWKDHLVASIGFSFFLIFMVALPLSPLLLFGGIWNGDHLMTRVGGIGILFCLFAYCGWKLLWNRGRELATPTDYEKLQANTRKEIAALNEHVIESNKVVRSSKDWIRDNSTNGIRCKFCGTKNYNQKATNCDKCGAPL